MTLQRPQSPLLKFLLLRQAECEFPLDVVPVLGVGGGSPNECMSNANGLAERAIGRIQIVSGWLMHRFDTAKRYQLFEQHWWNFETEAARYIDPSPNIPEGAIYIEDMELLHFYIRRQQHHGSPVGVPLNNVVYTRNKFLLAHIVNGRTISKETTCLSNKVLYEDLRTNI